MSDRSDAILGWLTEYWDGAPFTLEPASSDASFRRYLRARRGDESYIVMDAPPDKEDCRRFHGVADRLSRAGLNVPRVHAADYRQGLMLLTDLGSEHYADRLSDETVDRLYADALEALVEIQAAADADGLPPYDRSRLTQEMDLFPRWFLGVHLGIVLDPDQAAVLARTRDLLCANAAEQPVAFVHRDYHSRNLLVHVPNPGILDFQDAVAGPVTYDLVSLLRDVYVRWDRERVRGWALGYLGLARDRGVLPAVAPERFLRWFDLMGVQRHLKIAGIFSRLMHRDGKPVYLDDIPLALRYLEEVTAEYSELGGLAALMAELDLAGRTAERAAGASRTPR